jgi:heptosyltransferase-1
VRFLVVRLSALGDVVCTLPVAGYLKGAKPDCEIVWQVDKRFAGIVRCCRHVDRVVLRDEAAEGSFDVAFDMQGLFKSGWLVRQAKAERKLGYHWQREGSRFFSQAVIPDTSSFHIVDQYVDVARTAAEGGPDFADFGLAPLPEDVESISKKVSGDYVVLNPGAGWITKRWPPTSFARVAEWLHGQGLQAVVIGGKADADHAAYDEVARETSAPILKLTGETSVSELVALLAGAKAHVGGDTGSTHLAAGLNVPAIGLYSITRPRRSCPYGQVENCLYDPAGLDRITPDQAIRQLERVL